MASPLSYDCPSPCSSFLQAPSSPDSLLFGGHFIISRRLSSSSSSASLRLRERRGRRLPGLTMAVATAASFFLQETRTRTLYEVLGVAKEATEKEVRSAYRRLALRFHPDTVTETEQKEANTKAFLEIHSAYLTLSDEATRSHYNIQMSLQSSTKGYPRGGSHHTTQRSSPVVRQPYSPSPSSHQTMRGRSWETDQCW